MPGYSAIHLHLCKHYPKTGICDECGNSAKTEYALIRGREYSLNREDYRELCRSCHGAYDFAGERSPRAKLTADQVAEIRRRYVPGKPGDHRSRQPGSARALAEEFGVGKSTIQGILNGSRWRVA